MAMFKTFLIAVVLSWPLYCQFDTAAEKYDSAVNRMAAIAYGTERQPGDRFAILAAADVRPDRGESALVVLARMRYPERPDHLFDVRTLLVRNGTTPIAGSSIPLTQYLPIYLDHPGEFSSVGASAQTLGYSSSTSIIDVNLYSVLSGSGGIAAATDLIFSIQTSTPAVKILLNFGKDGFFSRLNVKEASWFNTKLSVVNEGSEVVGILVATYSFDSSVPKRMCYSVSKATVLPSCSESTLANLRTTAINRSFDAYIARAGKSTWR